jgi:hypothetical protein
MAKTDKTKEQAAEETTETETGKQEPEKAAPNASAKTMVKALRVRAFNDRFRRAGITFNKEEQSIPLTELTAEQIAQIKNEPMLAVSETEIDE